MVKNKKGWLRIVEAIFGIMIMASVLLIVYNGNTPVTKSSDRIFLLEKQALQILSENDALKEDLLLGEAPYTNSLDFFKSIIPTQYSFSFSICDLSNKVCNSCGNFSGKEVYSREIVLGATAGKYLPKIIRLSAWLRGSSTRETTVCINLLSNGESCGDDSECQSEYCKAGLCAEIPKWYFDNDCDNWGNGTYIEGVDIPVLLGYTDCINTTFDIPTINQTDCNDTNLFYTDNCPGMGI